MPITTEDTVRWINRIAVVLHENREYLTQLDSPIGDGDHGINMDRGFKAVIDKLPTVAEYGYWLDSQNGRHYAGFDGWRREWPALWNRVPARQYSDLW